jgi:hypothetical protein
MAIDPDLELQGLIVNRLKADPALVSLVGNRVYDVAPENAPFPYVTYGPTFTVQDDAECIDGHEVSIQLNSWSRAVGFPECKRINDAMRACLHDVDGLALTQNALVYLLHRQTQTVRDPDGLTNHGIVTLSAYVERRA